MSQNDAPQLYLKGCFKLKTPKSDQNKVISCPVCKSAEISYFIEKNNYSFDACNICEFMFLNPMPNQITLNKIYTDEDTKTHDGYKKASSRLRRAFIKLPRFIPYAFNKNSLDFGCGGGFVAYALSFVAKSSTGIDINEKAVSYAKKRFKRVNYYCTDFAALLKSEEKYDFVYSSEVIEHVSDINLYMGALENLVNKNGYLYITTPDLGHPKVPNDITKWDVLCPPIHVQHFTKKTVTILFKKYGFDIIKFYKNKKPGLIFLSKKS